MIQVASVILFIIASSYISPMYSVQDSQNSIVISNLPTAFRVKVPEYPQIDVAPLETYLLNELVTIYMSENLTSSNADLVLNWLPDWCFSTLADPELINQYSVQQLLGILYFSGYWRGVWLRARLDNPPPAVSPSRTIALAQYNVITALSAAYGSSPLDYSSSQVSTAVGSFGYNAGYFETIYNNPPTVGKGEVNLADDCNITYVDDQALTASYGTVQLNYPTDLNDNWIADLNNNEEYGNLKATCVFIQSMAYDNGETAWSNPSGFNVNGFSESDYNLLLNSISAYLEITQYNALLITNSVGLQSQLIAKEAAIHHAAYLAYTDATTVGLLNGYLSGTPFPSIQSSPIVQLVT